MLIIWQFAQKQITKKFNRYNYDLAILNITEF